MKNLNTSLAFTMHKNGNVKTLQLESCGIRFADKIAKQFLRHIPQLAIQKAISEKLTGSYARSRPTSAGYQSLMYPYTFYVLSVTMGRHLTVSDVIHAERMGTTLELVQHLVIQAKEVQEDVKTLKSSAQC